MDQPVVTMTHMASDRILIRHPKTGRTTSVTDNAFEKAWTKRGWERLADVNLDDLSKDDLTEISKAIRLPTGTKSETKAQLAKRISEAAAPAAGSADARDDTGPSGDVTPTGQES